VLGRDGDDERRDHGHVALDSDEFKLDAAAVVAEEAQWNTRRCGV
jgi:hypothetical protein